MLFISYLGETANCVQFVLKNLYNLFCRLYNETNSKYRRGYGSRQYSDMQICEIIDNQMLGRFKAASVYQLDNSQKQSIALELKYDFGVKSDPQIARCLAMNYLL